MIKKGDKVKVKAELKTAYTNILENLDFTCIYTPKKNDYNSKKLYRKESNFKGLVIGYSYLATGEFCRGNYNPEDYEPSYLLEDKRHKVWLVEPLTSERYFKPIPCLENDLEVLENEK